MSEPTRQGVEIGRSPATQHPQWCSPAECITTPDGTRHRSTPQHLQFRDCSATIHLECGDEAKFPGQAWTVEATVRITPALSWPDGTCDLYLTPDEMLRLNDRLTTEQARALLLSAPALQAVAS